MGKRTFKVYLKLDIDEYRQMKSDLKLETGRISSDNEGVYVMLSGPGNVTVQQLERYDVVRSAIKI